MELERLKTTLHPLYEEAMALYAASFPLHEQRTADDQRRALEHLDYHFVLALEQSQMVGLVLYWEQPQYLYIEHLCTVPAVRGQGLGAEILRQLTPLEKTLILEIDPPEDEISIRRLGFYQRAGFQTNPFPYRHPAYRRDCKPHRLVVLSHPAPLTADDFSAFQRYLNAVVMVYAQTPSNSM